MDTTRSDLPGPTGCVRGGKEGISAAGGAKGKRAIPQLPASPQESSRTFNEATTQTWLVKQQLAIHRLLVPSKLGSGGSFPTTVGKSDRSGKVFTGCVLQIAADLWGLKSPWSSLELMLLRFLL